MHGQNHIKIILNYKLRNEEVSFSDTY